MRRLPDCNEMTYEKCKVCDYRSECFTLGPGVVWICCITGRKLSIDKCVKGCI